MVDLVCRLAAETGRRSEVGKLVMLAQCGGALRSSSSGLTPHSNFTMSLYSFLYNDNKAALPF